MSNVQAELNKWYHVACIFGDNYQKLYLNGSLIKELSYSGMNTSFEKISLGGYFYAGGSTLQEYCNCYLASARIYNRVLTQSEITLLSREFDNAFLVFDMDAKKGIQDNSDSPCTLENHGVTIQDGCFVFDGNSYITTSQASKLNLGTGDFTIEVVLNLSTGNSNKSYPTILGGKDGWDYGANGLRWNGTHHRNGFAAFLNPGDPLMRSNTTFTPNDNTFITYTVQRRSGVWEQYFDGVKDSTTVSNSQEYNLCHNSGMCIGCSLWDGSNGYHIGLIKSVKIWNKARYQ